MGGVILAVDLSTLWASSECLGLLQSGKTNDNARRVVKSWGAWTFFTMGYLVGRRQPYKLRPRLRIPPGISVQASLVARLNINAIKWWWWSGMLLWRKRKTEACRDCAAISYANGTVTLHITPFNSIYLNNSVIMLKCARLKCCMGQEKLLVAPTFFSILFHLISRCANLNVGISCIFCTSMV